MAEFQYYSGEETAQGPKSTQTGAPAPPPNALQFFDDQTAGSQAWSNAIDTVMEAGTVAVDIATKLKEAEHQNQADAFFLDYTQKVQQLRDNINSGQAKSNQFDLTDINGVSDYYRLEEDKLYKDLSQKYNKQNYKRRDSIMRDRKAEPFLNSLSSVRRQRISEIAKRNEDSFNTYVQASTSDLSEQTYQLERMKGNEKNILAEDKQEYYENRNSLQGKIDKRVQELKAEALKRYKAGTINQLAYDNIERNVRKNIQANVANKLSQMEPEMFLDIYNNPKTRKASFGEVPSSDLMRLSITASDHLKVITKERERKSKLRSEQQVKIKILDADKQQDSGRLYEIAEQLKTGDMGSDLENRIDLAQTALNMAQSIENDNKKDPGLTKKAIGDRLMSWVESNLDIEDLNPQISHPLADGADLTGVIKNKEERTNFLDTVNYAGRLFEHLNRFKNGHDKDETEEELFQLAPRNTKGYSDSSFRARKDIYEKVMSGFNRLVEINKTDSGGRAKRILGQEERPLGTGNDVNAWSEAFRNKPRQPDQEMTIQLSLNGDDNGEAINDPTLMAQKNIRRLTEQEIADIAPLMQFNNAATNWPVVKRTLQEVYPNSWPKAAMELKRKGLLPSYVELFPHMSSNAKSLIGDALNWDKGLKQKGVDRPQADRSVLAQEFNTHIGSGLQTDTIRKELFNLYVTAYDYRRSRGEDVDITGLAKELFGPSEDGQKGFALVEAPFHLSSHQQRHVWFPASLLTRWGLSPSDLTDAMEHWIITKTASSENSPVLGMIGSKDIDPLHLASLTEQELTNREKLEKDVVEKFNFLLEEEAGVIQDVDAPFVTMARNIDGETLTMVIKRHPMGGMVRIGQADDKGHISAMPLPVEGTGGLMDYASRYKKKKGLTILKEKATGTTFWSQKGVDHETTAEEFLKKEKQNANQSYIQAVESVEKKLNSKEKKATGGQAKMILRDKINETIPELKDLESISPMKWIQNKWMDYMPSWLGGADE